MDRRKFIQQVMLYGAGLTLAVPKFSLPEAIAASTTQPDLSIAKGQDYRLLAKTSVELLGGMTKFVKPGDKVVIKPNIGWDRSPEQGANTHPQVIKGLIEMVLDAGAGKILIFDHTCNEKRRCYTNSGMSDMVKDIGSKRVKLEHIDQRKFVPVDIKHGKSLTKWDIYKEALLADAYINVPVAKHHGLSSLTLGLKNSMGVIGGNRGRLHHDLGQKLADLATVIAPTLTVIDATRILLRNGPQGGRISDVKQMHEVIASVDPVAADAYATTLFGLNPQDIDSTVAAHEMGLGQMNLDKVNLLRG